MDGHPGHAVDTRLEPRIKLPALQSPWASAVLLCIFSILSNPPNILGDKYSADLRNWCPINEALIETLELC